MENKPKFSDYIKSPMIFCQKNYCKSKKTNDIYIEKNATFLICMIAIINIVIPTIIFLIIYSKGIYLEIYKKIMNTGDAIFLITNVILWPLRYPLIKFEISKDNRYNYKLFNYFVFGISCIVYIAFKAYLMRYIDMLLIVDRFG